MTDDLTRLRPQESAADRYWRDKVEPSGHRWRQIAAVLAVLLVVMALQ